MKTLDDFLNENAPVIVADVEGMISHVNRPFCETYRWTAKDLVGKPISTIIPPAFRDAHHLGFSRFKMTREAKVLDTPLDLEIFCGDEEVLLAEHFIRHTQTDGADRFIATITLKK